MSVGEALARELAAVGGPRPGGATLDDVVALLRELKDGGHRDGWPYGRPGGGPASGYGHESRFLQPTDENTLTWGDTQTLNLQAADTPGTTNLTRQLLHVRRWRPTTFTILVNVQWGIGWTAENPIVTLTNDVGVGQARGQFVKVYNVATPARGSVTQDVFTLPAMALNAQVSITNLIQPGMHDVNVTLLAAPVYA